MSSRNCQARTILPEKSSDRLASVFTNRQSSELWSTALSSSGGLVNSGTRTRPSHGEQVDEKMELLRDNVQVRSTPNCNIGARRCRTDLQQEGARIEGNGKPTLVDKLLHVIWWLCKSRVSHSSQICCCLLQSQATLHDGRSAVSLGAA